MNRPFEIYVVSSLNRQTILHIFGMNANKLEQPQEIIVVECECHASILSTEFDQSNKKKKL